MQSSGEGISEISAISEKLGTWHSQFYAALKSHLLKALVQNSPFLPQVELRNKDSKQSHSLPK